MRIVRYTYPNRSPWNGLESEIDRLFNAALSDFVGTPAPERFPVDLFEDSDHAFVRAELPGLNRDDINVEVVDGYLTIEAARKNKNGEQKESFRFSRSVTLPETVRADGVSATYENGVLTVNLPKREEAKPRKISVAVK